jgi:hypothetical protein
VVCVLFFQHHSNSYLGCFVVSLTTSTASIFCLFPFIAQLNKVVPIVINDKTFCDTEFAYKAHDLGFEW